MVHSPNNWYLVSLLRLSRLLLGLLEDQTGGLQLCKTLYEIVVTCQGQAFVLDPPRRGSLGSHLLFCYFDLQALEYVDLKARS